jgi:hypothetical protein
MAGDRRQVYAFDHNRLEGLAVEIVIFLGGMKKSVYINKLTIII